MPHNEPDPTAASRQLNRAFDRAFRAKRYNDAYACIYELCRMTDFRSRTINNGLFTVLSALNKYEEAYACAVRLCNRLMAEETTDLDALLYQYQIAAFVRKRIAVEPGDAELSACVKSYIRARIPGIIKKTPAIARPVTHPQRLHLGYLLGVLSPRHAPSKTVVTELAHIDRAVFQTSIFTTEWSANWFLAAGNTKEKQSYYRDFNSMVVGELHTPVYIGPTKGDFVSRAQAVAAAIVQAGVDILLVAATDAEAITLLVAMMKPAPLAMNIVLAAPMVIDAFDCYLALQEDDIVPGLTTPQVYLPMTSDIRSMPALPTNPMTIRAVDAIRRKKQTHIVTGTFGNLFKIHNDGYLSSITALLKNNTTMFHVFLGRGDYAAIENYCAREGVLDRIAYFGFQDNVRPFIELLDVYLASFPYPGHTTELECMALGIPVVSMAWREGHHYNSGARIVGLAECIAPPEDTRAYCAIATRFMESAALRHATGMKLYNRFTALFSPEKRTRQAEEIYRSFGFAKKKRS